MRELFPNIVVDHDVEFGKPVVKGTRVPVAVIVGHLAAGDTMAKVMEEYQISKEQITAVISFGKPS